MSVDSIRYCLERATDDRVFEALCCDVLSCDGYDSIEPIGGTSDGGRDALHKSRGADGKWTIFAYSLRKDWKVKLNEDCERIRQVGHDCHRVVFAFIKQPTPAERDTSIAHVKKEFGWELELYGLERLRTQLAGRSNHLLSAYPSIFSPRFFENVAGELIGKEQRDLILIDHVESDFALATWLARRLEIAGYNVCCNGLAPFGGANLDGSVRKLIHQRAAKYLAILSADGAADGDLRGRCEVAASIAGCLLPITTDEAVASALSQRVREIVPISFANGWGAGLSSVLKLFQKLDVPQSWDVQTGRATALSSIIPEPLTTDESEELYSNAFPVESLPESIIAVPLRKLPNPAQLQTLREEWAFVLAGTTAYSFHHPPSHELIDSSRRFAESSHLHERDYSGRRPSDVVSELIRRCMELACYRAGLKWCPDREMIYFPNDGKDSRRIGYLDVTGEKRNTAVTGKKSLFRPGPEPNEIYRYFISPRFFASGRGTLDSYEVRLRLFLRITNDAGVPHEGRSVTTRRKAAAKGWFNQHWFAKTLAVMQHLVSDKGVIEIAAGHRKFQVTTKPKSWTCPVSIDSAAIARMMAEQKQTRDALADTECESDEADE